MPWFSNQAAPFLWWKQTPSTAVPNHNRALPLALVRKQQSWRARVRPAFYPIQRPRGLTTQLGGAGSRTLLWSLEPQGHCP